MLRREPTADLLGAPSFLPQLAFDLAAQGGCQFAAAAPNHMLPMSCFVLRLLEPIAALAAVPLQLPADRALAEPQRRRNLFLRQSPLDQRMQLATVFVLKSSIALHR